MKAEHGDINHLKVNCKKQKKHCNSAKEPDVKKSNFLFGKTAIEKEGKNSPQMLSKLKKKRNMGNPPPGKPGTPAPSLPSQSCFQLTPTI